MHSVTRRHVLLGGAASVAAAILAACGDEATPTAARPVTAPTAPATVAAPATTAPSAAATTAPTTAMTAITAMTTGAAATTAPATMTTTASGTASTAGVSFVAPPLTKNTAPSRGELRLALGFDFPATPNVLKEGRLQAYGGMEMLMRQTEKNVVEPWLAERVASVNPTTWRVTLRQAKFHDGSPVTPEDVAAAFKKNWDAYPDLKGLISPDTKITKVDERTVDFVTPQPSAIFPYALTLSITAIHKPSTPGGTDGTILTGPYRATKIVPDNECVLEPFAEHWSGIPPIAKISMRFVGDPNARILALQAGDTDMLYNFPPEAIKTFGPDIEASATPSGRESLINLNVNKPPFNDRAVREAFALGIDRNALNTVGLDGRGVPATQLFPAIAGYDTIPLQGTDTARARQLLDEAGWKPGADGVRAKGADKLAFTLLSYPGRADLTPYAVAIKDQLKPLGFAVNVSEVQNIGNATKDGMFDAAMKSNNTLPTGNPLYEYNRLLAKGGGDNAGNYFNQKIEDLIAQMRTELDPAKAKMLSLQVQEIVKADVPFVFLTVTPITTAFRKGKVRGYVPNPNDSYLINSSLSVS